MLPRLPTEVDRLDVQHYALRAALNGNHLAPVQRPGLILDVGSGTGQWAYDLCAEFPGALAIGLDLIPSKVERQPANYRFVRANVLQGLPFKDERFDFIHQRLLVTALPLAAWPDVVTDLVRILRPAGWIELVEGGAQVEPSGPATRRLFELASRLAALFQLDTTGVVSSSLDQYLRDAGVTGVQRRDVPIPIGEWGGRIGSLMASDFRATFKGLRSTFQSQFRVPADEYTDLLLAMQEEWEEHQTNYTFTFAWGRKPLR